MKNLFLDLETKDLTLNNLNNLRFTENKSEYTSQKIEQVLSFFLGEWWLNTDLGVDYFGYVLVKNPDLNLIRSIFSIQINRIETVKEIESLDVVYNTSTRKYSGNYKIKMTDNEILRGDF